MHYPNIEFHPNFSDLQLFRLKKVFKIKKMFSQIYFIFKKNNLLSLIGLSLEMSELKNSDF